MQDILINWAPQETRVALVENGAVQELHVERTLERGLVGNVYLGKVARVLPGMQSAFIDIGLERAAFLHVADVWSTAHAARRATRRARSAAAAPIEKHGVRRPGADGAGDQGPDRHQGRAAVDADQHRRAAAGLPAAGRPHRHLAEDRLARAARAAARAHERAAPAAPARASGGGFILRTNAEDASDAELADDIAYLRKTWARIRERALHGAAGIAAAPGPEPGRARAARPRRRRARRRSASTRASSSTLLRAVRPRVHAERGRQAAALQGRAADLRPVQRSTRRSRGRWRGAST